MKMKNGVMLGLSMAKQYFQVCIVENARGNISIWIISRNIWKHHKNAIKPEPLSAHLEMAFAALVEQMMRPVESDQMEKAPISGGNGEGKMDRTSGETWKRSMDGAKRKRIENTSANDDSNSMEWQRRSATSTIKKIRGGKRMKNKKASRVRKAGREKGQQQSNDADECGTVKTMGAGDDPGRNEQFKLPPAIVRREYCLEIIDKYSHSGKLHCQLCSAECVVIMEINTYQNRSSTSLIQHALGHLEMPIYHCRLCTITEFTSDTIRKHVRECHQTNEQGYEDCSDQYQQQIMDMVGQCFDTRKKCTVEQGEHVSAVQVEKSEEKCVVGQFKFRPALVRRQYCLDLAQKFSTAGKLECRLCSAKCAIVQTEDTNPVMVTNVAIQHALAHLKMPIYRCRIYNITKFTYISIKYHTRRYHPTCEEGYEDCSDNYQQEMMDILEQCYDSHRKCTVERMEKPMPGRWRFV